jgi:hypothetical protein
MRNNENGETRYISQGYKDRDDYLSRLAEDRGIDMTAVRMIVDMLGPSEDFEYLGRFNNFGAEGES